MATRQYVLNSPVGEKLLFYRMQAEETLSRLGEFQLECLSLEGGIKPSELLAESVTVDILLDDDKRELSGFVTRFAQLGKRGRYHHYVATIRPWFWFLTRTSDCRIFQNKSVPDIIKEVFADHSVADFRLVLRASYQPREYCVQYRESDFDFVSRLMEEEGIYYFFEHKDSKHTMVLTDSYSAHETFPGYDKIPFVPPEFTGRVEKDHIESWRLEHSVKTGKYALTDYDFKKPSLNLLAKVKGNHGYADYEVFDYPGEYLTKGDGEHYAQVRLDEYLSGAELAEATGDARGIAVGFRFNLEDHPETSQDREYLVLHTRTTMVAEGYESDEAGGGVFSCACTVMDCKSQDFRPRRVTPRPFVKGPQTAVVVGPGGDEIHTDEHARVKVQFHWDRYGGKNENSSCWIRVATPWAGKGWGMVSIPRIGQEVVVEFLEGDPDRPLITGSVYNAEQVPPYALPANKTQSGIKSRSSTGGDTSNFNEIRFEDKKGSELVYVHAEKDRQIVVENDETHSVGHDRSKVVDHDETVLVKHDRNERVDNNETISIGVDQTESIGNNRVVSVGVNHTETIGAAMSVVVGSNLTESVGSNYSETVGAAMELTVGAALAITVGAVMAETVGGAKTEAIGGAKAESIGGTLTTNVGGAVTESFGGNHSLTVSKDQSAKVSGKQSVEVTKEATLQAKKVQITADDEISFKTGDAEIVMKKNGDITIKGGKITIKGSGDVVVKGSKIANN